MDGFVLSCKNVIPHQCLLPSNRHPIPSNRRQLPSNHCRLLCNRCLIVRLNIEPVTGRPEFVFQYKNNSLASPMGQGHPFPKRVYSCECE